MNSFRLGRLFGIEIRVDWSWVFIFLLMTWNLGSVFLRWHEDWSPAERIGVAAIASGLFFGCILLHELAHSAVATRFGLRVRNITLFLFGGVSNIEQEPTSAKIEFLTAVVGPLTSVALGFLFSALVYFTVPSGVRYAGDAEATVAQLGPIGTLLVWLGPTNVIIGLFNLIPAFPLDGGRVFRAALWGLTRDLRMATVIASAVGQIVGWSFILAGMAISFGARLPIVGGGLSNGLWLAFVGWFIHSAASQAHRRISSDGGLADPPLPPDAHRALR